MSDAQACTSNPTGPVAAAAFAGFVRDPASWRGEAARYGVGAIFAAFVVAALLYALGTHGTAIEATDSEPVVLIDLPPALASSQAARDAADGPEQAAAAAAPAVSSPPRPVDPPKPIAPLPPVESSKLDDPAVPLTKPEPPAPKTEQAEAKPPKKVTPPPAPPPSPAMAEQAPRGSDAPVAGAHPDGDEGRPHAAAHVITAWQRSLVGRLETAKRALPGRARRKMSGTVQVAFAIDHDGRVVSQRVTRSSGSSDLDDTALSLVRKAAPFPTPPTGTGDQDLSFIVPIRFQR